MNNQQQHEQQYSEPSLAPCITARTLRQDTIEWRLSKCRATCCDQQSVLILSGSQSPRWVARNGRKTEEIEWTVCKTDWSVGDERCGGGPESSRSWVYHARNPVCRSPPTCEKLPFRREGSPTRLRAILSWLSVQFRKSFNCLGFSESANRLCVMSLHSVCLK